MNKPHLKPPCYSTQVTVERDGAFWALTCAYCHRTWRREIVGATFEEGRLTSTIPSEKESSLQRRRENIAWTLDYNASAQPTLL